MIIKEMENMMTLRMKRKEIKQVYVKTLRAKKVESSTRVPFTVNHSWFPRCNNYYNVAIISRTASTDVTATVEVQKILENIRIEGYLPRQIFNIDERIIL